MLNDYFIEFYFINITIYFTLYTCNISPLNPFLFKCFNKILRAPYHINIRVRNIHVYWNVLCAIYEWGLRDVVRGEINVFPVWMAGDLWRSFLGSVAGMTLQGNSYLIRIKSSLSVTWGLDPVSVTREERLTNTPNIYQIWLSLIF